MTTHTAAQTTTTSSRLKTVLTGLKGRIGSLWANRSLATRFLIVYLLISSITVATLTWRSGVQLATALEEEVEHELELQAYVIASALRADMEEMAEERRDPATVITLLNQFASDTDSRITLLDSNMEVIFSTDPAVRPHREHAHPEVLAALRNQEQHDVRMDEWTQEMRLFVAAPIREEEHLIGLVQISIPWERVRSRVIAEWMRLIIAGGLAILANILVSLWLARGVVRPLQQLTRAAREIAAGNLEQRIPVQSRDEVGMLAVAFNEMAERLQEMIQRQHMFIANASHELRSPLTSIKLRTEALLDEERMDPERRRRFLEEVDREADRLRRLAERLLDLTRLQIRPEAHPFHEVDLGAVLTDALTMLQPRATRGGIHLEGDIPPDLPRVWGSDEDLSEVIYNLLDNALKHTPEGGTVRVTARADETHIHLTVADTGVGIPPEDLPHIFEPFYRVDKARSRRKEGNGLGLAIVKAIVETHGGTIEVTSTLGEGTTFHVQLPRADARGEN